MDTLLHLDPFQAALLVLAVWLVLALGPQLPILITHARDAADWEVVAFRGALLLLGATVALRYFFDLTPWIIVVGWLVLDVAATLNTVYIWRRARNGHATGRDKLNAEVVDQSD